MAKTRLVASLLVTLALLPTASPLDAQIGGLIKKKVVEKAKGETGQKTQPAASSDAASDESKLPTS